MSYFSILLFHTGRAFWYVAWNTKLTKKLYTLHKSDVEFDWIFSASHHEKGEADGHGATSKCGIRTYVLEGK